MMDALAEILQTLGNMSKGVKEVDFRAYVCSIIAHAVEHWDGLYSECGSYGFGNDAWPQISYLHQHLGAAVDLWASKNTELLSQLGEQAA